MSGEMSSLEDIFSTNQCPTAVFTSQGTAVTPNGDSGVCKVIQSLVTLYHNNFDMFPAKSHAFTLFSYLI